MERLDACYFCGTAADAPLREVSITHRARAGDPDASVSVTLCPDCEGKLQTVLGHVFEHVESRRAEETEPGPADAAAVDDATAGGGQPGRPPEPDPVDRIDVSASARETAQRSSGGGRLDDDLREVSPEDDGGPDEGTTPASGDDDSDTAEEAEELEDEAPTVRATARSADDPLDGVSVAEYNRVMRLLQNREFPMARDAFVDLAASAYDLGEDTVQQVLEAAIDQGGLEDRDGDLVRPGEGGEPTP